MSVRAIVHKIAPASRLPFPDKCKADHTSFAIGLTYRMIMLLFSAVGTGNSAVLLAMGSIPLLRRWLVT